MKKGLLLITFTILNLQSSLAYDMQIDTIAVIYDTYQVEQFIVHISNTEEEPLWIWLFNTRDIKDETRAIRKYLLDRHGYDFSIFDIGSDPNMMGTWWNPSNLYHNFVKHLKPGKSFTIILYREEKGRLKDRMGNWEKAELAIEKDFEECNINDFLKIYRDEKIQEHCPGIEDYGIKRISYPYDSITLPAKMYMK